MAFRPWISLDIAARTSHHGVMEPSYRDKAADGGDAAVQAVVLDVDGEVFELRPDEYGGTGYSWLTGPNSGYGFGTSPTPGWSADDHRRKIRWFLTQIDPATGYIGDE